MDASIIVVVMLACGGIAAVIARAKNHSVLGPFVLGALLGIIGILIVAVQPSGLPTAPPGMRAVKCVKCSAVQNIPEDQTAFGCWQCKFTNNAAGNWPPGPEDTREWLDRAKKKP
jgi:hypothetical protein